MLREEFGKKRFPLFLDDVRTWPLWIEHDEFLAVHGGVRPDRALEETSVEELVNMRTWDGTGENLQSMQNPPWFEFYKGRKLIVFGHWAALGGVVRKNVIGLDTGCVYGGTLTAVELPERKIVSVRAKRAYRTVNA